MRPAWPNGYILKDSFKVKDDDKEAVKVSVNLPGAKQNLNLGRVKGALFLRTLGDGHIGSNLTFFKFLSKL